MFYDFPVITHLDQVLAAIEGDKSFIVADRGDHVIVNYMVSGPDTFPPIKSAGGTAKQRAERTLNNRLRRECRGIIFDKQGNLIRRPYHKFFNLNERDETQFGKVDLSQPHHILEKYDGSMIVPYQVGTRVIWGTKMGDTDVATPVHDFVDAHPEYLKLFEEAELRGFTLIFEWMSRKQRIVIDHPEDKLVLTAIRSRGTGEYFLYEDMVDLAAEYGVPVGQEFAVEGKSIEEICAFIQKCTDDTEGVVIRFNDGHMVKIKTEDYVRIHKAKEAILRERNVVDLIINEKLDDVLAMLPEEDRVELVKYQEKILEGMANSVEKLFTTVRRMQKTFATNKDYSLSPHGKKQHARFTVRTVFQFLEKRELNDNDLYEAVYQYFINGLVRINLNNDTKFGEMKQEAFPNIRFVQNKAMN